ncbi:hypothetical protein ACKWTF_000226 [Chironomus riparius]
MTNISLTLESNVDGRRFYYPGEELRGTAILYLDSIKKFKGFYIKIFGQAKSNWTKESGKIKKIFEGTEIYINSRTYLFGEPSGTTFELQPGTHKFNFVFPIPFQIPSSLTLKFGRILYYVEAVLDIPWKFDKEVKVPFTVFRFDDLNFYRNLKEPVKLVESKSILTFSAFAFKFIKMTVSVPYSGYAVGQSVPITINYENETHTKVVKTSIKLIQTITYFSPMDGESKQTRKTVVNANSIGVDARHSKKFLTNLKIPPTIYSNSKFCKVITVCYTIDIAAQMSRVQVEPKLSIPIIIGGLPIRFEEDLVTSVVQPTAPPLFEPLAPVEEELDEDLPPTYDEAIQLSAEEIQ